MNWLLFQWERFKAWWDELTPCYKESIGYNCKHRVYPSGAKECGEEPNYWQGDNE
jgi:hypothetical protein